MPSQTYIFTKPGNEHYCVLLREENEWGFRTLALADPPRRLLGEAEGVEGGVEEGIDYRRVTPLRTPAQLLQQPPDDLGWLTLSRRSISRLYAHYLVTEDPQRRLDARAVETLAHQVSLTSHVLQSDQLKYLLLADEVGLGKTIEAGLLLKELISQNSSLRVLYLAPARLVSNVYREFERLGLNFRQWTAQDTDARLESDSRIIASIHRAVHGQNHEKMLSAPPWDVIIVDECHHLSAWSAEAGDPTQAFSLVRRLVRRTPAPDRVIFMSGTPHQGHTVRFDNLLKLLKREGEADDQLAGRVIYRTKDDVTGWDGQPLFPTRQVNPPLVLDLGSAHRQWIAAIHDFYSPPDDGAPRTEARRRAAGWRCAQAMQWATSSPQAGLGYLARQAMRAGWTLADDTLRLALATMRPYRLGPLDEPLDVLFARIFREIASQQADATVDDIEEYSDDEPDETEEAELEGLLQQGIALVRVGGDEKWAAIDAQLLANIGTEKVVLFAQPIETVTALARYLERKTGVAPALIIGGQKEDDREQQIRRFRDQAGPQFLVSSRAGGEGINLQVARRLIHVDVPWNPMDMEQRVGRVHRFGSRETILVDTVVVQDSREADAYASARHKLRLITETLVGRERFESVYSRVMALLPQEEFQNILIRDFASPLSAADQDKLSEMVQRGFQNWKSFHDKYSEQQKAIRYQPAGLANWDDVVTFLEKYAGATRRTDFTRVSFSRAGQQVEQVASDASVLTLRDGLDYIASEYVDGLTYGPDGLLLRRLGLNSPAVLDGLRKHAFEYPAGPAHLKWSEKELLPGGGSGLPAGVLAFVRQTWQATRQQGWQEAGSTLHVFATTEEAFTEVTGSAKGTLLRGLFQATVTTRPDGPSALTRRLAETEPQLAEMLRRPTDAEFERQVRHAVLPVFAAIVTSD